MFRTIAAGLMAVSCVLVAVPRVAAEDKTDGQAKELFEQFVKALKAKDLDGLMKICDVPFCKEGKTVVRERDEVKKMFQDAFDKRDFSQDKIDVLFVGNLEQAEEKAGRKIPEERRKTVEEVLGKEYRIVLIEVEHGDSKNKAGIIVRFEGGKGKIAGILN